jgi:hypothetical protein
MNNMDYSNEKLRQSFLQQGESYKLAIPHHSACALDDYTKLAIGAVTKKLNTYPDKEKSTC